MKIDPQDWNDFVAPSKRLENLGPFLTAALDRLSAQRRNIKVLDTCMGTGGDALFLAREGYAVTGNEIDPELMEKARKDSHSINNIAFSAANWLEISQHFPAPDFDAVLCIGNSLCLLESEAQVQTALKEFYKLLRPGGMLIADERNFPAILENRAWRGDIFQNPWQNFINPGYVMYRGDRVRAAPKTREGDLKVTFSYVAFKGRVPGEEVATLDMLAFRRGALRSMAQNAGFQKIQQFRDLRQICQDPMFLTYICEK